jgi:hypothetical protein
MKHKKLRYKFSKLHYRMINGVLCVGVTVYSYEA